MKKAIIIIIALLVVLTGTGVVLWFFTPVLDFLKPASDNFSIQAKKLFGAKEETNYSEYIASIEKLKGKDESYTSDANISMNVTLPSSVMDYSTQKILNSTSVKWHGSYDSKSKTKSNNVTLLYDKKEMVNLDTVVNGKTLTVSSKDFYDKALTFDFSKFKSFCEANNLEVTDEQIKTIEKSLETVQNNNSSNFLYDLLYLTEDEYKALDKNYNNLLTTLIDEDKYTSKKNQKITVGGEEIKATGYSLTISGEDAYNYIKKLAEMAKDDDNLKSVLVKKINLLKEYSASMIEAGLDSYEENSINPNNASSRANSNTKSSTNSSDELESILSKDVESSDIEEFFDEFIKALEKSEDAFSDLKYSLKFTIYSDSSKNPVRFDVAIVKGEDDEGAVVFSEEVEDGKNTYTIDLKELAKKLDSSSRKSDEDDEDDYYSTRSSSSSLSSMAESIQKIIIVDEYEKSDASKKGKISVSAKTSNGKQDIINIEYEEVNSDSEIKNNIKISSPLLSSMSFEINMEATGLESNKQNIKLDMDAAIPVGYSTYKVKLNAEGSTEYGKSDIPSYDDSNSVDVFTKSQTEISQILRDIVTKAADILPSRLANFGINVSKEEILRSMPAEPTPETPVEGTENTDATQPAA